MTSTRTALAILALVGTIGCANKEVPAHIPGETLKVLRLEAGENLGVLARECGVGPVNDSVISNARSTDYSSSFVQSLMDLNPRQFRGAVPLPGLYKVPARLCPAHLATDY